MNFYNFNLDDAIVGLFNFYFLGILFGSVFVGFFRFLLLSIFERREG